MRACALVTLACSLAAAGLATPAQAFLKGMWGPAVHGGVSQFPVYQRLGVRLYEATLYWSQVATRRPAKATVPGDPAYRWPADLDAAVAQAQRYHIRVAFQIIGSPGWANGGRPPNWAPRRAQDYADFAAAAARHYPSVHLWMVWGEPSRTTEFEPLTPARPGTPLNAQQQVAPHAYARLLDAAYGALKRVSRTNLVVGGMTYTTGDIDTQQWIENLRLPNGARPRMDLYGHNPFHFRQPDFGNPPSPDGAVDFSDLPRLAHWLDRYLPQPGHRHLPLFLSEWTIPTAADPQFNFYVDPPVQASWITAGLRLARHWSRIYALGWINLYDSPGITYGGLLTADGQAKPGLAAFAAG